MMNAGSRTGTGETGRLHVDPKPSVVDEIEAEQDAVQIRVRKGPVQPSADRHETQCDAPPIPRLVCALHRREAPDWPHSRITQSSKRHRCVNWMNRRGDTDILTVLKHCPSLVQCCDRRPANHVVQAVSTFMDFQGLKKICLRTDGRTCLWCSSACNDHCSKQ